MSGVRTSVKAMWTRLRISRYRARQADVARQDRDSEERLRMAEEGIDPYGRPRGMGF
jgi:hypothetical protein